MINECPKIPLNNIISKYINCAITCFILYIIIIIIGIYKRYNLNFSYFELFIFLLFLIYKWFYLLGFLIFSILFNLIQVIFILGVLIQNKIPINSDLFKYIYYVSSIILDMTIIKILFELRKEGKALIKENNEGIELENVSTERNIIPKSNEERKTKGKKGYIPFSGKGTVVG